MRDSFGNLADIVDSFGKGIGKFEKGSRMLTKTLDPHIPSFDGSSELLDSVVLR
jgi:hypothetical protein